MAGNTGRSVSGLALPFSALIAQQQKSDHSKVNNDADAFFWISYHDCLDIDNKINFLSLKIRYLWLKLRAQSEILTELPSAVH